MTLKKLNIKQPKTDKYKCIINGETYYAYFRDAAGLVRFFTLEEELCMTPLDKQHNNILDIRKFSTQTLKSNNEVEIAHKVYLANEGYYVSPII